MSEWTGEERRAIPIHVLNYVDRKLEEHIKKVDERLYTISTSIEQSEKSAEERHNALINALTVSLGKIELIESAFLRNESGDPDFNGHHYEHDRRKRFSEWWEGVKDKTITKVVEWSALAFIAWALHALWEQFLKGPGK